MSKPKNDDTQPGPFGGFGRPSPDVNARPGAWGSAGAKGQAPAGGAGKTPAEGKGPRAQAQGTEEGPATGPGAPSGEGSKGQAQGQTQGQTQGQAAEEPAPTESSLELELEQARVEAQEWKDKYVRLHAEWDTYRRRTVEAREAERATATEKFVEGLLPIIDDFERTLDYADKKGGAGLSEGVKAIHSKITGLLTKEGVVVLDPQGDAFDSLEAQAVGTLEDPSVNDETVAEVLQKGYKMGKKVLRPAMVMVAYGGPKRKPKDV